MRSTKRPSVRRAALAGTVLALVLTGAACGGDDDNTPATSTPGTSTATTGATTSAASSASSTTEATTASTTASTLVLLKPGDACGVYGAKIQAGSQTLYCDGATWGTTQPPPTTASSG